MNGSNPAAPEPHDLDEDAPASTAAAGVPSPPVVATLAVPEAARGQRLDAWLTAQSPDYSRVQIKRMIEAGQIRWKLGPKNGAKIKAAYLIQGGEELWVAVPAMRPQHVVGEEMALRVLYEDAAMVVIDKPAGLVVHPGAGVLSGTLANGLVGRYGALAGAAADRPGIVHRLDRETSGVIVAARTDAALRGLMAQFEARTVRKTYLALAQGSPADTFTVEAAIGRHPVHRMRMAIVPREQGRGARTEFSTLLRFAVPVRGRGRGVGVGLGVERTEPFALLACFPKTGRTHQLRVHLKSVDCPIVADGMYGSTGRWPVDKHLPAVIERQALHAYRLALDHPLDGQRMTFIAPLAADMAAALDAMAGGDGWRSAVDAVGKSED